MKSSLVFSLAGVATLGLAALFPAEGRDGPLKKLLNLGKNKGEVVQEQAQASKQVEASSPNTLSSHEKSQGFELLFNGKDYQGWDNKGNWIVEDGAIARKDKGGGITFTAKKYPIISNWPLNGRWPRVPTAASTTAPASTNTRSLTTKCITMARIPEPAQHRFISVCLPPRMPRNPWENGIPAKLSAREL